MRATTAVLILSLVAGPAAAQEWRYNREVDPLDDSVWAAAGAGGDNGGGVVVSCDGVRLRARVFTAASELRDPAPVRYRFDQGEPFSAQWSSQSDLVSAPDPYAFARQLMEGDRLIFEITDFFGVPQRTTVQLAGSGSQIRRVLAECPAAEVVADAALGEQERARLEALADAAAAGTELTDPVWVARPGSPDLSRFYPPRAAEREVGGRVVVRCLATGTGSLSACRIVAEDPPGLGFGQATLRLVSRYRMQPRSASGVTVAGREVEIEQVWSPGR